MEKTRATVKAGHGVASGRSTTDTRFPRGTIRLQEPFFKEKGFDFQAYFGGDFVRGTLNLSLSPRRFTIESPEYVLKDVKWTDLLPAENFFLSPAEIHFQGRAFKALIYIPDPATKPDHFQAPDIIEVIAESVPNLDYGDEVELAYNPEAIKVK